MISKIFVIIIVIGRVIGFVRDIFFFGVFFLVRCFINGFLRIFVLNKRKLIVKLVLVGINDIGKVV